MQVTDLPPELLLQCLTYLSPLDLVSVAATCRSLRSSAETDSLWARYLSSHLNTPPQTPDPFPTFKSLYTTHHPYWFIPWRKLWLSDNEWTGGLVYARYNAQQGTIEAFRVVAERDGHSFQRWSADPAVVIQEFDPVVKLHLEAPVIKIERDSKRQERTRSIPMIGSFFSPSSPTGTPRMAQEVLMDCSYRGLPGHKTSLSLARDLPASYASAQVWPSLSIPAPARTRNISASDFSASSHRPSTFAEASQSSFRIRRWLDFRNQFSGMSMRWNDMDVRLANIYNNRGEAVETFGTIDDRAYTPTPAKPYRGIFCGDYSGHGPEFIAVLQPDDKEVFELPEGLAWLREWFHSPQPVDDSHPPGSLPPAIAHRLSEIIRAMQTRHHGGEPNLPPLEWEGPAVGGADDDAGSTAAAAAGEGSAGAYKPSPLVAVKLTGDPHVPRGEITFISPDIGDDALVRVADEDDFRGARVVRSAGHIANRGFSRDYYVPSQLILVSHDCLAQYWQCFNQISFYRRVDLDALAAQ